MALLGFTIRLRPSDFCGTGFRARASRHTGSKAGATSTEGRV
ncbi:hypothetical protein FTUN_1243 [Frigoriglobus tundricola]|uniref:Uncharacterized protein n=1 Tax=Frigoriglobus tundricola TaxID=2774151 RepID=A0A6M5YL52_9BACT|nr:hypothetical protein FTUN_1243 [Frigoriglobus tundricola]